MKTATEAAVIRLHDELITPAIAQLAARIFEQTVEQLAELEPFAHRGLAAKVFGRQASENSFHHHPALKN